MRSNTTLKSKSGGCRERETAGSCGCRHQEPWGRGWWHQEPWGWGKPWGWGLVALTGAGSGGTNVGAGVPVVEGLAEVAAAAHGVVLAAVAHGSAGVPRGQEDGHVEVAPPRVLVAVAACGDGTVARHAAPQPPPGRQHLQCQTSPALTPLTPVCSTPTPNLPRPPQAVPQTPHNRSAGCQSPPNHIPACSTPKPLARHSLPALALGSLCQELVPAPVQGTHGDRHWCWSPRPGARAGRGRSPRSAHSSAPACGACRRSARAPAGTPR